MFLELQRCGVEAADSRSPLINQPNQTMSFQLSERSCFKTVRQTTIQKDTWESSSGLYMNVCGLTQLKKEPTHTALTNKWKNILSKSIHVNQVESPWPTVNSHWFPPRMLSNLGIEPSAEASSYSTKILWHGLRKGQRCEGSGLGTVRWSAVEPKMERKEREAWAEVVHGRRGRRLGFRLSQRWHSSSRWQELEEEDWKVTEVLVCHLSPGNLHWWWGRDCYSDGRWCPGQH